MSHYRTIFVLLFGSTQTHILVSKLAWIIGLFYFQKKVVVKKTEEKHTQKKRRKTNKHSLSRERAHTVSIAELLFKSNGQEFFLVYTMSNTITMVSFVQFTNIILVPLVLLVPFVPLVPLVPLVPFVL